MIRFPQQTPSMSVSSQKTLRKMSVILELIKRCVLNKVLTLREVILELHSPAVVMVFYCPSPFHLSAAVADPLRPQGSIKSHSVDAALLCCRTDVGCTAPWRLESPDASSPHLQGVSTRSRFRQEARRRSTC